MNREENLLRKACEEIAEEETEALRREMDLPSVRQIDALYRRHQQTVSALLDAQFKKRFGMKRFLEIAACLALLMAAGAAAFRNRPEPTPLSPGVTASVLPYYTQSPTPEPTVTPEPTHSPTPQPTITPAPTPFPTEAAEPASAAAGFPTPFLDPTNIPTVSPTDAPVLTSGGIPVPTSWRGAYFPDYLSWGLEVTGAGANDEQAMVILGSTSRPDVITFTEYFSARSLPAAGDEASYVPLNGVLALRETSAEGVVTLTWDQDGRTFRLTAEEDYADGIEKMAAALQKISE